MDPNGSDIESNGRLMLTWKLTFGSHKSRDILRQIFLSPFTMELFERGFNLVTYIFAFRFWRCAAFKTNCGS